MAGAAGNTLFGCASAKYDKICNKICTFIIFIKIYIFLICADGQTG